MKHYRETDRYYDGDIFMVPEVEESGIDNNTRSRDNIYEYRDVPIKKPHTPQPLSRTVSRYDEIVFYSVLGLIIIITGHLVTNLSISIY